MFDRMEYYFALAIIDYEELSLANAYLGRFCWHRGVAARDVLKEVETEIKKVGPDWPLLKAGLSKGDHERLSKIVADFNAYVERRVI